MSPYVEVFLEISCCFYAPTPNGQSWRGSEITTRSNENRTSRFWKRGKSSGPEGRYWNAWHWKIKRNASSWERKECTKLQLVFNSSAKKRCQKKHKKKRKRKQNHESRIEGMKIKTVSTASSRNKLGFNGKELSKSRKYIHADVVINIKTKVLSRCEFFFHPKVLSKSDFCFSIFHFPHKSIAR